MDKVLFLELIFDKILLPKSKISNDKAKFLAGFWFVLAKTSCKYKKKTFRFLGVASESIKK